MSRKLHLYFLAFVKIVSVNSELSMCSCKRYQRYGYPCHHMFHIMNVYNTAEVKKEWIHIRWYKHYIAHYLQPETSVRQNELYNKLISMHPRGPRFHPQHYATYPRYKGFNGIGVSDNMFFL